MKKITKQLLEGRREIILRYSRLWRFALPSFGLHHRVAYSVGFTA